PADHGKQRKENNPARVAQPRIPREVLGVTSGIRRQPKTTDGAASPDDGPQSRMGKLHGT
ncbi:MAG: hypothetical protein JW759_07540, partial [Candidatus Coatesbacteria bacterium]|nr:hypothetical protein [Candidatus Coatesbacteria bacterium]